MVSFFLSYMEGEEKVMSPKEETHQVNNCTRMKFETSSRVFFFKLFNFDIGPMNDTKWWQISIYVKNLIISINKPIFSY